MKKQSDRPYTEKELISLDKKISEAELVEVFILKTGKVFQFRDYKIQNKKTKVTDLFERQIASLAEESFELIKNDGEYKILISQSKNGISVLIDSNKKVA